MKELVKNRKSKLVKSTTLFMALFVTAIMLGSAVPAAVINNPVNENIIGKPNNPVMVQKSPSTINAFINSESVNSIATGMTTSTEPASVEQIIKFHSGYDNNAIGFSGAMTWEGAIRITPTELGPYSGYSLVAMNWYHYDSDTPKSGVIKIYTAGTSSTPGALLATAPYDAPSGGLYRVDLTTPILLDTSIDLWVSIEIVQTAAGYPLGIDAGPQVDGKGGFLYYSGAWYELQALGLDYNWVIEAVVDQLGPTPEHDMQVLSIDAPVTGGAGVIVPMATVKNSGNNTETNVPVNFQITKNGITHALFSESFEGTTYPPTGWTKAGTSYNVRTTGGKVGTYTARMYSYGYGYWGELVTPQFDGTAGAILNFWHKQLVWAGDQDYLSLQVSTDGGATYGQIIYYGSSMDWTYETINLASYVTLTATMKVKFYAYCNYGYGVYIDGVAVSWTEAPVAEYNQTATIASINAGETLQVSFPAWTPTDWQSPSGEGQTFGYTDLAKTQLAGDLVPSNDLKTGTFSLTFPYLHDLMANAIVSPAADGLAQTFECEFSIKNVGQFTETYTTSWMNIGEVTYGANAFYYDAWTTVPPTGWVDEHDAIASYYGWSKSYSNYAGGTSPEARLPYYYAVANKKFITPAFSTVGADGAVLNVKSYINHYSGQGLYTLKAAASADNGATWSEIWSFAPSSSGKFEITGAVPIGSQVKVAFYCTGDPYYFNYWYIDDVKVQVLTITSEFNDGSTIDWQGIDPGEIVTFSTDAGDMPYWTPDHLATGISAVITYGVTAYTDLTGDTNPSNDKIGLMIDLTYTHDVTIKKVNEPAMSRGEVIFSQLPYGPYDSWTAYTSDAGLGYEVRDNFWDLTATIGDLHWWALTLIWSGGWYPGTGEGMQFKVIFYDADKVPFMTFEDQEPTFTDIGYYSWAPAAYFELTLPQGVQLEDGWVAIQSTYSPSGSVFLWLNGPNGDFNAEQNGASVGGNVAFNLTAGGQGPQGPPPISVYLPVGPNALEYIINNVGTFVETDLAASAVVREFITNVTAGTEIENETHTGITLDPLGDEQTETFTPCNFATEGRYGVYYGIPLAVDDKIANNFKVIGVGVDDTPPVSAYTITPAAPDGLAGWYVTDVTIKLTATDPTSGDVSSGVDHIEYSVDGGAWTTYPGSAGFKVTSDSAGHIVKYKAIDKVGNEESEKTIPSFKMDKTKPVIDSMTYNVTGGNSIQGWELTFYVNAHDAMSGMVKVEFYYNEFLQETVTGAGPQYVWAYQFTPLPNVVIKAIAYDEAGWFISEEIENPDNVETQNLQQNQPLIKIL